MTKKDGELFRLFFFFLNAGKLLRTDACLPSLRHSEHKQEDEGEAGGQVHYG